LGSIPKSVISILDYCKYITIINTIINSGLFLQYYSALPVNSIGKRCFAEESRNFFQIKTKKNSTGLQIIYNFATDNVERFESDLLPTACNHIKNAKSHAS
jgi:hypothetical protein